MSLRGGAARLAGAFRKQFGLGLGPELSVSRDIGNVAPMNFPLARAAALAQRHLLQEADRLFLVDDASKNHRRGRHAHHKKASLLRHYAQQMPPVMLILPPDAYSFASDDDEGASEPELVIEADEFGPMSSEMNAGGNLGSGMISFAAADDADFVQSMFKPHLQPLTQTSLTMASFPMPEDPGDEVAEAAAHIAGELQGLQDRMGAAGVDAVVDDMYRDLQRKFHHKTNKSTADHNNTKTGAHNVSLLTDVNLKVNQTIHDHIGRPSIDDNTTVQTKAANVSVTIRSVDSTSSSSNSIGNISERNISAIFDSGLKEMREALENSSLAPDFEFPDDFGKWPDVGVTSSASSANSESTSTSTVIKDGKVITTTEHCENGNCTKTTKSVEAQQSKPSALLAGDGEHGHTVVY